HHPFYFTATTTTQIYTLSLHDALPIYKNKMINKIPPKVKSLLISEPFMLDPNFTRSVVLICEHNEEGTLGLVLNQPSNLLLEDVDRKSTRLNSSHVKISYAVFCLKKKK